MCHQPAGYSLAATAMSVSFRGFLLTPKYLSGHDCRAGARSKRRRESADTPADGGKAGTGRQRGKAGKREMRRRPLSLFC